MDAPLTLAVIGLGRMGRIYARTVAEEVDEASLLAVVDPVVDPDEELKDVAVPNAFDDAAPALARSDLDGVLIATPTSTHADLVVKAAEAGAAIFCEKPLALTRAETNRALAAVERAGVPLQVGFMRRFDEAYRTVYEHIRAGRIGRPLTFKAIGRDPGCPDPAFANPARSGGLILDMAVHDFDLARWLMGGEVERVWAEGTLLVCDELRAAGDIDNAVVNLSFADGALGNVEVSRNAAYGYDVRTEVLGSDGLARVPGRGAADAATLIREKEGADDDRYLTDRFGEAYRAQIHHFVECVRAGRTPSVTGADAKAAFEIGLAATFSARTGEPVSLEAVRSGWTPDQAILS